MESQARSAFTASFQKAVTVKTPHHYETHAGKRVRVLGKRERAHADKILSSGRAMIEPVKVGRKTTYHLKVKPGTATRFKRAGEHPTLDHAMGAVLEHFPLLSRVAGRAVVSNKSSVPSAQGNYYDVGAKIGGARKDIAQAQETFISKPTGKGLANLEKQDPDAAARCVTKAHLWPRPSFSRMRTAGCDAPAILLAFATWSCVAPKPAGHTSADRQLYLAGIQALQKICAEGKMGVQLGETLLGIGDAVDTVAYHGRGGRVTPTDEQQVLSAVAAALGDRFKKWVTNKAKVSGGNLYGITQSARRFFPQNPRDTSVLAGAQSEWWRKVEDVCGEKGQSSKAEKTEVEASNLKRWERTVPTEYERKGGPKVTIRRPEDYLKRFGLRGVEFGNWMDEASSRVHVERCAEALQDMADVLEIPSQDLSMHGRLALAFGARGSGRFLAHYEPGKVVINLTKTGGAGSLGHEWGHFLDDILGRILPGLHNGMFTSEASVPRLKSSDSPVAHAMAGIIETMHSGATGVLHPVNAERAKNMSSYPLDRILEKFQNDAQGALDHVLDYYHVTNATKARMYADYLGGKAGVTSLRIKDGHSEYLARSQAMGKYWSSGREMFARAFETYLLDKMAEKKRFNNYLVFPGGMDDADSPYPQGAERAALTAAFDKLFESMRADHSFKKAFELLQRSGCAGCAGTVVHLDTAQTAFLKSLGYGLPLRLHTELDGAIIAELRKSWSGDLLDECSQKFGGECHWITLHGKGSSGDGAHVMISPPQGASKHRRIVWAPEGTGLEHLRLDGLGENSDIKARATDKKAERRRAEVEAAKSQPGKNKNLSPAEIAKERENVAWHRERKAKYNQELDALVTKALHLSPDDVDALEDARGAALKEASKTNDVKLKTTSRDSGITTGEETPSSEPVAEDGAKSGSGAPPRKADAEKSDAKTDTSAAESRNKTESVDKSAKQRDMATLREAVAAQASDVLSQSLTGASAPRSVAVDKLENELQAKVRAMSPADARAIIELQNRIAEFDKNAKKVLSGRMARHDAEGLAAQGMAPGAVESQVKARQADRERVRQSSAFWQKTGERTQDGSNMLADSFSQGGVEAVAALVSNSLGASVSPQMAGALGVSGMAHVLASEIKRRGDAGELKGNLIQSQKDLVDYIEGEAAKLSEKGGPLDEVAVMEAANKRIDGLIESGDLNQRTGLALKAHNFRNMDAILGQTAGRLNAGAELARALSATKDHGDLVLDGGTNATLAVAQMDAAGLSEGDYKMTVTRHGGTAADSGDGAENVSITIPVKSFPKLLAAAKKDGYNERIREGKTIAEYKPPPGYTDDPSLQLRDNQIQHVQFQAANKRTVSDQSTGGGKTATALVGVLDLKHRIESTRKRKAKILIITTASVRDQFGQEADKFAPGLKGDYKVANGTTEENGAMIHGDHTLTIVAHDSLVGNAADILKQKYDGVFIDEADKLISPEKGAPSIRGATFQKLAAQTEEIQLLTATVLRNSTGEYFEVLHALHPERFPSRQEFLAKYSNLGDGSRAYDAAISEALNNETRDTVLSSRLGEGDLHEHREETVPIMADSTWRQKHADIEKQYGIDSNNPDKEIRLGAAGRRNADHMLTSYNISKDNPAQVRARKIADESFERGERTIIFADYKNILGTFSSAYKPGEWLEFSGDIPAKGPRRSELKAALNTGAIVKGVRVAFNADGRGSEGVVAKVNYARPSRSQTAAGQDPIPLSYVVQDDEGNKHTVPASQPVKSLLRGLTATKAAQYGLNLQQGGRGVLRLGHPYTPTAYEQEVGRLRSREQSQAGRATRDHVIATDHPVAGERRRAIFEGKQHLTRGRELQLLSDEHGA